MSYDVHLLVKNEKEDFYNGCGLDGLNRTKLVGGGEIDPV